MRELVPVRDRLRKLLRPAFELVAQPRPPTLVAEQLRALPLGGSRIGGWPDLPASLAWPTTEEGRPLAHAVQVNLAEVAQAAPLTVAAATRAVWRDDTPLLPTRGWFWLFLDLDGDTYRAYGSSGAVFHQWDGPVDQLRRRRPSRFRPRGNPIEPDSSGPLVAPCALVPKRCVTAYNERIHDDANGNTVETLTGLDSFQLDAWCSLLEAVRACEIPLPEGVLDLGIPGGLQGVSPGGLQLLGHPTPAQGSFYNDASGHHLLLLTVPSFPGIPYYAGRAAPVGAQREREFVLGDLGELSVLIHRSDLAARRFGHVDYHFAD